MSSSLCRSTMPMRWGSLLRTQCRNQVTSTHGQKRWLSLNEHQSQILLEEFGLPTVRGIVARTPAEARKAVKELGSRCTIKPIAIHGHRSQRKLSPYEETALAVGVPEDAEKLAVGVLESLAKQVYVAEAFDFDEEWYLALSIDRENYCPAFVLSKTENGTLASQAFVEFRVKASDGVTSDVVSDIAQALGALAQERHDLERVLQGMYKIFNQRDATLLEINSLVRRKSDGALVCREANIIIDDAAAKRQPEIFALRDSGCEAAEEIGAEKYGLVYVKMHGTVGNVVNGAGLAMATNDAISLYGGSSANFLDAGGQATKETMIEAFRIVMSDEKVKSIIVNVYGGITRCDMIAESVIGAATELGSMKVPIVVRLQGTNSAQGLKLLEDADLGLHVEADFGAAARKAVELAH